MKIRSYHDLEYDPVSGEIVIIDNDHHEMQSGNHYFAANTVEIDGAGTVSWFMFTAPNTPTRIHAKALFDAEAEFKIEIRENGIYSSAGISVPTFNNDRDSENTSELEAYASPTVTNSGTFLWAKTVGSGKDSAGVTPGLNYEVIAKTGTVYLFKITKAASGTHWLNYDFFWYEHVPLEEP